MKHREWTEDFEKGVEEFTNGYESEHINGWRWASERMALFESDMSSLPKDLDSLSLLIRNILDEVFLLHLL